MTATTSRNVRVPDALWVATKLKAASDGVTVSDVIRDALQEYVEESER